MPKSISFRGSSSNASTSTGTEKESLAAAKKVYGQSVLWHGTKHEHLKSLREAGFSKSHKQEGATSGGTENMFMNFSDAAQREAQDHHYLSSSRNEAKNFAMFADMYQPALARTIGVGSHFNLQTDPRTGGTALMTNESIPPRFVLGSKSSSPGANAQVFEHEMSASGYHVSTEQAGRLLREVQSDSDEDTFPDPDDFIMSRLRG